MGKKSKKNGDKPYVIENLISLGQNLHDIRQAMDGRSKDERSSFLVNVDALGRTVKILPQLDRENVEKFWGLNGGPNHSKKAGKSKDIAFIELRQKSIISMRKLFELDYVYLYEERMKFMVSKLLEKINREGVQASDLEVIKYLVAYLIVLQNGPNMPFSDESITVGDFEFDEYSVIYRAFDEFKDYPDNSINLKLIKDFIEMLDFEDGLTILKTFKMQFPELPKFPKLPNHPEILEEYKPEGIEAIRTFLKVRDFKERVFRYGNWSTISDLIFGEKEAQTKLEGFMEKIDSIRNDWSKIKDFKTGQCEVKTSTGVRTLDVYSIGGLEFTDIYEIMFLYVERNCVMVA